MAVIEQLVISKVIMSADMSEFRSLRPDHFAGHFQKVWEWMLDYEAKHNQAPTERAFSYAWGDVSLSDVDHESASGLRDELLQSYRKTALTSSISESVQALDRDDFATAEALLSECLQANATEGTGWSVRSWSDRPPAEPELIEDLIADRSTVMLYGDSGTYKTYLAIDLAFHVATGTSYLNRRTRQSNVLYVCLEGGAMSFHNRCTAWQKAHPSITVSPDAVSVIQGDIRLTDPSIAAKLVKEMKHRDAHLLIVDTFSQATPGHDENDAGKTAEILNNLRTIAMQADAVVMFVHHENKVGQYRGSTTLAANVDISFRATTEGEDLDTLVTLTNKKQKTIASQGSFVFTLDRQLVGGGHTDLALHLHHEGAVIPKSTQEMVYEFLDNHSGPTPAQGDIARAIGRSQSTVSRALKDLVGTGHLDADYRPVPHLIEVV